MINLLEESLFPTHGELDITLANTEEWFLEICKASQPLGIKCTQNSNV